MRACAFKQGHDPEGTGTQCSRRVLEGYSRSKCGALYVIAFKSVNVMSVVKAKIPKY